MYANERKLRKSGFDNEIKDGRITINSGKEVEVYVAETQTATTIMTLPTN
jgi:hypothetical protein